jgi:uncharacterized protein (DUF1800 family)
MSVKHSKKVLHLYWRAGFGLSPNEVQQKSKLPIKKVVKQLIEKSKSNSEFFEINGIPSSTDGMMKGEQMKRARKLRKMMPDVNADWVKMMANSYNPLLERMTLFWHDHFACRIKSPVFVSNYMNAIRGNALGSFRDLVIGVSKSPAMIRYLNNQQNRKRKPNENFARELLELFTIGRGNYTENDIKEAARAFTGWTSNLKGEFVFREKWHDTGKKTFMGSTGNFGGEDIINLVLARKETAFYITTKIYKYFVNEKINETRIKELADYFYENDYDIGQLMSKIFTSDWFYAQENIGIKIKSPIDMLVGMMKVFDIEFKNSKAILFTQRSLGQILFDPPNVAGWVGGKSWIDNSTLIFRLNYASYLFNAMELNIREKIQLEASIRNQMTKKLVHSINANTLIKAFKGYKEEELFDEMKDYLLVPNVNIDKNFVDEYTINNNSEDYIRSLTIRLMSLPEYQMC